MEYHYYLEQPARALCEKRRVPPDYMVMAEDIKRGEMYSGTMVPQWVLVAQELHDLIQALESLYGPLPRG